MSRVLKAIYISFILSGTTKNINKEEENKGKEKN